MWDKIFLDRYKKRLGSPRFQGGCHSCVSCVVCDMVASALATDDHDHILLFLSPQHIIDCMKNAKDDNIDGCGCKRTNFEKVFKFFRAKGVVDELVYPYKAEKQKCRDYDCPEASPPPKRQHKRGPHKRVAMLPANCKRAKVIDVGDVQTVKTHIISDFERMKAIIELGPVGVTIDATRELKNHREETGKTVFMPPSNSSTSSISGPRKGRGSHKGKGPHKGKAPQEHEQPSNKPHDPHAVLIIGYGYDSEAKTNFYLVKNSWGSTWGYLGYAKIAVSAFSKSELAFYLDPSGKVVFE